jgi:hypothetical protein
LRSADARWCPRRLRCSGGWGQRGRGPARQFGGVGRRGVALGWRQPFGRLPDRIALARLGFCRGQRWAPRRTGHGRLWSALFADGSGRPATRSWGWLTERATRRIGLVSKSRIRARLFVRRWRAGLGLRMCIELDAAGARTRLVGRDHTSAMRVARDVARRGALARRSSAARRFELPYDLAGDLLGQHGEVRARPRWAHARIEPLPAEAALDGRRLDCFSAERAGLHGSSNVSQPAARQALSARRYRRWAR